MKRFFFALVLVLALLAVPPASAAPATAPDAPLACSGLFFSEYIEGSSNNKALEIFDGTGSAIDLAAGGYKIEVYFNGSATAGLTINLTGMVANGDVYVVAHDSASAAILAQADQTNSSSWYNGNDAVVLKQGATTVDVIGQVGVDPGSEWGAGLTSTADNTLRRKSAVSIGDTNGSDAFDPSIQWDGYAKDTFDGLGSHTAACAGGGDIAPYVFSTSPANGATGVALSANLIITFSEPVTVTGAWYDITCTGSGGHAATVSGGPTTFTLNPVVDFSNDESCTATVYAAQVSDQDGTADPMTADTQWDFSLVGAGAACSTIPLIQGTGNTSPCQGSVSNIRGCITGVGATGFYMQAVGSDVDGNPATSDGIYVYRGSTWTNPSGWAPGNLVRVVSGTIIEYYNTTEFQAGNSVTRLDSGTNCGGNGYPAAVPVGPITDPAADPMSLYERYEGMRVRMSFHGWVVEPTKRFISRFANGDPELALVDFGSTIPDYGRVFERDYPGYQGINYISGGLDQNLPDVDFGDEVSAADLAGVLGYQFDKYTLLVDAPPALTIVDRPDVESNEIAADTGNGEFDICFSNVENLFDNINDGNGDWGDWAPGYPDSNTSAGQVIYQAKLAKVAGVFVNKTKSCMLIGVEEMEGKQGVYDNLAAALHSADPAHTWTGVYVESGDSRDISQGFLYRNDVARVGSVAAVTGVPYTGWVADGVLNFVRTSPTALFRFNADTPNQLDVRLYAMHFKSKSCGTGCTCSTPDCTDRRELEAADMRDILAHHRAAGELAIAGGDFNDTFGSTPIAILDASASIKSLYYDLGTRERYSYIFNGESEVLDHVYVTANLLPATSGWGHVFRPIHVNADFPAAEHASDHDPLRTRFVLCPADSAADPTGLGVARNGSTNGVDLSWLASANAAGYQVWRDAAPYFTPTGAPLDAASTPAYTDPNVIGDPPDYFVITAVNACGQVSGLSNRVGEFDFALTPGQ